MKSRGTVIYLRASVNHILQRTGRDKNRPLLQTADPRQRLEELTREREPLYCEVADLIVETGRPNIAALVQSILDAIGRARTRLPAATAMPSSISNHASLR